MSIPVSSIRNLGPAFEQACARAGIASAEALRTLGADAAYAKLLQSGTRPHFISYYVLVMGLQGRPWNDCKGTEKLALRGRFDALQAHKKRAAPVWTPPLIKSGSENLTLSQPVQGPRKSKRSHALRFQDCRNRAPSSRQPTAQIPRAQCPQRHLPDW